MSIELRVVQYYRRAEIDGEIVTAIITYPKYALQYRNADWHAWKDVPVVEVEEGHAPPQD